MNEVRHNRRKRWLPTAIKLSIAALVVWFIHGTIIDACGELGEQSFQIDFLWLAASGGLYLLGTLPFALFWHRTLRALGQRVEFGKTVRAYYIGHLGKYVPGKAMVVILRAGLLRGPGIDASLAVASIFYETLTMMSTGALLAASIVAFCFSGQPLLFWTALGIMAVAGLPTLPPIFKRLARLAGVGRINPATVEKLDNLGYGTVILGWTLNAIGWAILGLSFWAVLRAMGLGENNPFEQFHLYAAAVSLATVAGFISMMPGGAVVREAVLTEFMVPYLGGGAALIGAILLRLVWLVAEMSISGILYFGAKCWGDSATTTPTLFSRRGRRD
ncbi:MAG: flippase-like domain-containing protein [Pirellulales bacterium]|nr:flippase-like domain-containing protein [Pirellulales bacterium]